MQRLTLCLFAALLVGPALPHGLPHADAEALGFSPERLERVGAMIEDAIEQEQLAGAVALIARRGQIAYLEAFGERDRESRSSMQTDTIFRIASQSKAIVSTAAPPSRRSTWRSGGGRCRIRPSSIRSASHREAGSTAGR